MYDGTRDSARKLIVWAVLVMAAVAAPAYGARGRKFTHGRGDYAPYRVTTPKFEIEFSVKPSIGRTYAVLCERAYGNLLKKYNLPGSAAVWDGKCRVKLFADRKEFQRFASDVHRGRSAAESGGYTIIRKADPDIVLYLDGNNHTKLKQVLVHELTHVFLQLFGREARIQTWLHEGFAQYFEFSIERRKSRLKASRARVKRLVKSGKATPLKEFWTADFPATDVDSYAQAWSLIDFMIRKGSGKRTGDFILTIKDGVDQDEALQQTFGCSLGKFEKMWKRYVLQAY